MMNQTNVRIEGSQTMNRSNAETKRNQTMKNNLISKFAIAAIAMATLPAFGTVFTESFNTDSSNLGTDYPAYVTTGTSTKSVTGGVLQFSGASAGFGSFYTTATFANVSAISVNLNGATSNPGAYNLGI